MGDVRRLKWKPEEILRCSRQFEKERINAVLCEWTFVGPFLLPMLRKRGKDRVNT